MKQKIRKAKEYIKEHKGELISFAWCMACMTGVSVLSYRHGYKTAKTDTECMRRFADIGKMVSEHQKNGIAVSAFSYIKDNTDEPTLIKDMGKFGEMLIKTNLESDVLYKVGKDSEFIGGIMYFK